MVICSHCNLHQLDGTIFCEECGASLMPEGYTPAPAPKRPARRAQHASPCTGHTPELMLVIGERGRQLNLALRDQTLIGRADPERGISPAVDLTPDGGLDAGVSRRHALISYHGGRLIVEDLGSANGTYVNGRRAAPHAAVLLRCGDELHCGRLRIQVAGCR